jgi:hypothetical protein
LFPPEKAAICLLRADPFPTLFSLRASFPPGPPGPPTLPPHFLLVGSVGGWGFFNIPKTNYVLATLREQRVKICRIFFDFWRTFFLEKRGSLIEFFAIKKKRQSGHDPQKDLPNLATP